MQRFKPLLLLALAMAPGILLAQEVAINGKDFESGAADAKLAEIARQAAAAGKSVVVTAPAYWQGKAAAKLHAGAPNANVQAKEGFFENVLVRIEDAKAAPPPADTAKADATKADAAKAAAAKAAAAKAEAARAEAEKAEAERVAAEKAEAERKQAERVAAAKAEAERKEAERIAAEKAETQRVAAAKAAAEKAEADRIAAIKQRMQKNLNDGKAAEGEISAGQLQKDDLVAVDGDIRGVARRDGAHTHLYWLSGELNLDRVELQPLGDSRFKVSEPLRSGVVLRSQGKVQNFVGKVPAANSAERSALQRQYAEGKDIAETLRVADLRTGDTIYTGNGAAVVTRRVGNDILRYWLEGEVNLGQTGLQRQGNAYKVLADTIK